MISESDAVLVERSRRSDAGAFGSLVERHQGLVFGVALARCGDPALAEEVAQEAFVTAWRDLDRLREAERVGSWVAGIARNLASSAVRDRARREKAQLPAPGPVATPEDEALEREDRELLQRSLAEVAEDYREALVLYYVEGQAIARIAEGLGVSEDVIKQRLSRGRRALRDSVTVRVESVLTRMRPGPKFGAGVVTAVMALGSREALATGGAGKAMAIMTMKQKVVAVGIAVLTVGGGAAYLGTRADGSVRTSRTSATAPAGAGPSSAASAAAGAPSSPHVRRLDPAKRESLLGAIRAAKERRERSMASSAPSPGSAPPALPTDDQPNPQKEYIRAAVKEIVPMIAECYEHGLERDPKLAGRVSVRFTIEGEPGVGGVVGESSIRDEDTTLKDPLVRECIQETMYALAIDPPQDGGTIEVHYPFEFRPAEPE